MKIGPRLKSQHLAEGLRIKLVDGREHHAGLLGVTADSKRDWNSDLAKSIDAAFKKHKTTDEHGPHFLLAWRLYPNKEHPRWQVEEPHSCGCGCGNIAPLPDL
jgi:hypothetical protein